MGHYGSTRGRYVRLLYQAWFTVYRILKIIYKIGEDEWRAERNTKLKYLEIAGAVKGKVRERN